MSRTWITSNAELCVQLRDVSENAWTIDDVEHADLAATEIITVGWNDWAKDAAFKLRDRAIPAEKLSYVDLRKGDDVLVRIGSPKHLFWDDVIPVEDIEDEDFEVYPSGISFLDLNLGWGWRLPELVVLCGPYGCGKSTLGQLLAAEFVHGAGRGLGSGAMLCSWEDLASEVKRNMGMFATSRRAPDIGKRVHFVRRKASEDRLVSWYMDLVRYHKRRYGTRFFFLDPWNEMDHQRDHRQMETDYVMDMMRLFRDLVDQEGIIIIIATHIPGKYIKGNGDIEPFKIGNAFGSSNFGNKADRGICLARTKKIDPNKGHAIIRLDKAKVERKMGRRGTIAAWLDDKEFRLNFDAWATGEVQDIWKD